ncbi:metallophosphoesterase [uncultured Acetobacteroides sp.]|uniref:metallophosphoesterase n=1 Tax=uncultured Acetobacteroides sp. TaxID=1760811 RepID=UPI0029F56066|nr:metallophosphoesterase [uncultured Acetobacteroides sp.]
MNVLVISDLHLGNGDRFGTFEWSNADFIAMLKQVVESYRIDQVVLNGDILELYKYRFRDAYLKNKELMRYFKSIKPIVIKGNHDFISPIGVFHHTIVNAQGKKIYFEHGHDADFLNGTRIGRAIGFGLHLLLKRLIGIRWVEDVYFSTIEGLEDINRIPRKYNTYKYLKHALKLLRSYDVVVLGHTHKVESHNTYYLNSKKQYCNTGSCTLGRFQGVVLDTETLRCETIKYSKLECRQVLDRRKEKLKMQRA